jgi:hypothetical protein
MGVNGKFGGTGTSISHIRLLFRQTLHLLIVKVKIPFKTKENRCADVHPDVLAYC